VTYFLPTLILPCTGKLDNLDERSWPITPRNDALSLVQDEARFWPLPQHNIYPLKVNRLKLSYKKFHSRSTKGQALGSSLSRLLPTLHFFCAWTFLNLLINVNYPALENNTLFIVFPSPEILVLLTILYVGVRLGMPFHPVLYLPLTTLLIFSRLFVTADVLVPVYLNRSFNLFIDSRYVPDLIHLLYHTVSSPILIGCVALAVAVFVTVGWLIWRALKTIHFYFQRESQVFLGSIAVLMGVSLIVQLAGDQQTTLPRGFFHRVLEEVDFVLQVKGYKAEQLEVIRQAAAKGEQTTASLDKLHGANVLIFFVESYGHTVFADPRHFSLFSPVIEGFEQSLQTHGFSAVSHFLESPTYGGTSWLAHGTFASGVRLDSQLLYNVLVTSRVPTIAHYFGQAGYTTVSVMPGTTWPWPEGDFFGYQKKYYAWNFDYKGPRYGWSPMPDQYVLDYIHRHEIQGLKEPFFIEYVLVTSHAPFHRQPPYLENWSQIADGSIYHHQRIITFPNTWPDLTNATEAYMTSINYDFRVLEAYIEQYIEGDGLVVILGDHQPNGHITGDSSVWSVPIHVISRNQEFLKPFAARGYTFGLIPTQPPPHPGMESFLFNLLEDFSTIPEEETTKAEGSLSLAVQKK